MSKELLMIFTRNPVLGKVKSRLATESSESIALLVYQDLLAHTHDVTCRIQADKWIFYSDYAGKNDIWDDGNYVKKVQSDGDLGVKMYEAFKEAFNANYTYVVIIGSDIEEIDQGIIEEAFNRLSEKTVIGPAADGGYYLLGLKAINKEIFENKKWGSDSVLSDTLSHFSQEDVFLLPTLNDIDVLEDIKPESKLRNHLKDNIHVTE